MKKLLFLSIFALFALVSANVFGQGTGTAPQIGSSHQYWVNGTFGTPTGHASSTYTWWISNTVGDLKTKIASTTDFNVVTANGGAAYDTPGATANGIELIWKPTAAGKTYYLVVEENDGTCTNIKATAIKPINAFDVIFAAIDGTNADSDNPSNCAPDINLSASDMTITYDYGTGTYIYKIASKGLYSNWTFNWDFTNTLGKAGAVIAYSTDGSSYTNETTGTISGTKTVTPNAGLATVYFKVTVDNGDTSTPATAEEGTSGQSMVLKLSSLSDGTNQPAHIYKSNGTTEFGTDPIEQTQTVKARPATTGIDSN